MTTTIADAITAFKDNVAIPKENTRRLYHRAIDAFGEFVSEIASLDDPIQSLKKNVLASFSGWMAREREYSQATQKLYRSVLRAALRYWRANHEGWIRFSREEEQEAARTSLIGKAAREPSRHSKLPGDFAERMLTVVLTMPLRGKKLQRLAVLRVRALIFVLWATALRVGDVCSLTKEQIENARVSGRLEVRMKKTEETAHARLSPETLAVIDEYLQARADNSPWLFIQHGKSDRRGRAYPASFFRNARRGYGARLSTVSAWRLVQQVAKQAGFDRSVFTSPHAFRHWHALTLRDAGVSLENIQAVLGHSSPTTTRSIYAPEPNRKAIDQAEIELQRLPQSLKKLHKG